MLAKIFSCAMLGLEGNIVEVEVDSSRGMPSFTLVGLPDAAVKESSERVRAAIRNCGLYFPNNRVTVNLAPADVRKVGPSYDLPIALGLLMASEQIDVNCLDGTLVAGELALDGSIRHVRGILPSTAFARDKLFKRIVVPACDAEEAALVEGIEVICAANLHEIAAALSGATAFQVAQPRAINAANLPGVAVLTDFAEIKGQEVAKRAVEVAAAGGHNLLMAGSPGAGKTLLARAMPGILPALTASEALDITRIYSVADQLPPDTPLIQQRPFRAPHHTISHAGMIGGGKFPRPGEVSLAHRGVLFRMNFEFNSRQPLSLLKLLTSTWTI